VLMTQQGVPYYALQCDSPAYVTQKTKYSISVVYKDGKGAKKIPFQGVSGMAMLAFDMIWTKVAKQGSSIVVDVNGLDAKTTYMCQFADAASSAKKLQEARFLTKYKLDCGKQPSGFKISIRTSRVVLKILAKGTTQFATFTGTGSETIELDSCANGVKDGAETDTDCGGGACGKCAYGKACSKGSDCENDKCSKKNKCGAGGGTSEADAGESCKQIKRDTPKAANGRYWITGWGSAKQSKPFKVFCWNADRSGGGWTLMLVNWYTGGPSTGCWREGSCGNVDADVLAGRNAYKLDDKLIRATIGQKDTSTATKFDIMQDANGRNSYYSNNNREYNILNGYTAKWHFTRWRTMDGSSTKAHFVSYEWSSSFDGKTPLGDGSINWQGRPKCDASAIGGAGNGAGVNCRGQDGSGPNGGHHCRRNLGMRWSGALHFYMAHSNTDTYVFVCNSAQHTSGHKFSHRWWIRSGKDSEKE